MTFRAIGLLLLLAGAPCLSASSAASSSAARPGALDDRDRADDPAYRHLWGDVAAGAPRGGLEPALATGESSPEVLREAMKSAKHNYYGLYKRRFA